ncbi:hypothetical protein ACTI_30840 [Actinoplanes sp. OR16]|uniref:NADAR family protein n=1 Tax=Actinoplanes sp. OR16 TaxID=946334 RepID=UPI000F6D6719|nr:NADAR family protein [Actinoplanes sp. OR16]BBH66399.1 hypothetical protein ACTI_30840 [Actinoplanes sp. OR16]
MTLPLSLADLLTTKSRVKYLYFWGHRPSRGNVGPGCLSQWWPCRFTVDGSSFGSAEHYMMWRKARLFGDEASASKILAAKHPAEAKKLGRGVAGFSEDVWVRERFAIVTDASVAKFGADPALRDYLLGTRNRVLVEASPLDRIWGIGLAADDPRALDPARWRGLNLLGFALMKAREELA